MGKNEAPYRFPVALTSAEKWFQTSNHKDWMNFSTLDELVPTPEQATFEEVYAALGKYPEQQKFITDDNFVGLVQWGRQFLKLDDWQVVVYNRFLNPAFRDMRGFADVIKKRWYAGGSSIEPRDYVQLRERKDNLRWRSVWDGKDGTGLFLAPAEINAGDDNGDTRDEIEIVKMPEGFQKLDRKITDDQGATTAKITDVDDGNWKSPRTYIQLNDWNWRWWVDDPTAEDLTKKLHEE